MADWKKAKYRDLAGTDYVNPEMTEMDRQENNKTTVVAVGGVLAFIGLIACAIFLLWSLWGAFS